MKGYYGMPRETKEALRGGWFHTGDVGRLDEDGYLQIMDRKKDLIVTSTGKKIAPQVLENRLKLLPFFDDVVVVGDRRHFLSALVTPNYDALAALARANRIPFQNAEDLVRDTAIYAMVMEEVNRRTADLANFEKIRKIAFVTRAFTIAEGDLTPTLKIRRSEIERKCQNEIDDLYAA
jgi:long-chain acyl-CoA synthetase